MTLARDLETPAVTVHVDIMEDNIRRVQAHLARHGIGNRPHIKTHKIPAIGKLQMAAGAMGITCQKLGEVEVFVRVAEGGEEIRDDPSLHVDANWRELRPHKLGKPISSFIPRLHGHPHHEMSRADEPPRPFKVRLAKTRCLPSANSRW